MEHLRLQGLERDFVGSLVVSETRKVVDDPCFVAVLEEPTERWTGIKGSKLGFKRAALWGAVAATLMRRSAAARCKRNSRCATQFRSAGARAAVAWGNLAPGAGFGYYRAGAQPAGGSAGA